MDHVARETPPGAPPIATKAGLAPGTVVHVGEPRAEKVRITLIDYDAETFHETELDRADRCASFKERPTVTWVNLSGVHEVGIIEALGRMYDLHPLLMEDIVHTAQRPKAEDFDRYVYIVLKMLYSEDGDDKIEAEQVSIVLGKNYVLTFQEGPGDVFDAVRNRLRNNKGRVRKMGADYLAYSLIDAIVDNYFALLETMGEKIENLEHEVVTSPDKGTLNQIYSLKREMIFLRRSVWPLRKVISNLERGESALFSKTTLLYLRDVYDHIIRVIDTVEAYRDAAAGMIDLYLSSLSNRMNDVMKVLTIIATIFIPLTFITGVCGMNFDFMPELHWRGAYFVVWTLMLAVAALMILYFRRKKWL